MNYHLGLIGQFIRASLQEDVAYRANFAIGLLNSLLNLGGGLAGLLVIFDQVDSVRGWDFGATLAVLGIYLTVNALRDLFIGPSFDALVGMAGDVWRGTLDFTLLRPVDMQFLTSFRRWRLFSLVDLVLGLGVLGVAISKIGSDVTAGNLLAFLVLLGAALTVLYSVLLAFTALTFWNPTFMFGWVFNGIFQMARYPVHLYPGWLRLVLVWVVPVGFVTSVPAQALTGDVPTLTMIGGLALATISFGGASVLFRTGLRRYASASS